MDTVVNSALEEICSHGDSGLHLEAVGRSYNLQRSPVKALNLAQTSKLRSLIRAKTDWILKIVALEHMCNGFIGICDIDASDAKLSKHERRVLDRLATVRWEPKANPENILEKTNEVIYWASCVKGNFCYIGGVWINLCAHGQELGNSSIKNLGSQQRLEITKGDNSLEDNEITDGEDENNGGVAEESLDVLAIADIKPELGYQGTRGHRKWRYVCKRLGISTNNTTIGLVDIINRFGIHMEPELMNKAKGYRLWTPGNYNPGASTVTLNKPVADPSEIPGCTPLGTHLEFQENSALARQDVMLQFLKVMVAGQIVSASSSYVAPADALALNVPTPPRRRSYPRYPCLPLEATSAKREQWILKLLQEEKFLVRSELFRRLQDLEKEKTTMTDRRTLDLSSVSAETDRRDSGLETQIRIQSSSQLGKRRVNFKLNDLARTHQSIKLNQAERVEAMLHK
ncbi:hypothetical protein HAX54_017715 [Datura stramonium]|uniref:Uncharacterized protein n=1 Tax=Datura stramonium TaxID=4076 RepID=A0ABS8S0P3_DATST|nr:hypothetical protein [Datura stramonium]